MRIGVTCLCLLLCGCRPGLVFNESPMMSADEMLQRSSLVFVGVIEKQTLEWPTLFPLQAGQDRSTARWWRIARRQVRVETVLRGSESRPVVDVYEIYWTDGTSGDWNSLQNGERALFLVRVEDGKYHVVRDWWRSIFPITTGPHTRMPLDDSHSFWERVALMNWRIPSDPSIRITHPYFRYLDPGGALTLWRIVKLERGLVRHPSSGVRVPACRELLSVSLWGQDECWEALSEPERAHLRVGGYAQEIEDNRRATAQRSADWWWQTMAELESRRLLTAINNPRYRAEFCRFWKREYPDDHDNGCPSTQPPRATIVTEKGDIPLVGAWPR